MCHHGEFKACNILLENNFHAAVADFDLGKQAPEGRGNTCPLGRWDWICYKLENVLKFLIVKGHSGCEIYPVHSKILEVEPLIGHETVLVFFSNRALALGSVAVILCSCWLIVSGGCLLCCCMRLLYAETDGSAHGSLGKL